MRAPAELATHPLRGSLVEHLVVSELHKVFIHHGQRPRLWFWRDRREHEVDLIWGEAQQLLPNEIKAGVTAASDTLAGLDRFCALSGSDARAPAGHRGHRRKGAPGSQA